MDNVLHSTLTHLERGGENDEAISGQQLCATVPTAVTDKLKLSPPPTYFNADQAILATLCQRQPAAIDIAAQISHAAPSLAFKGTIDAFIANFARLIPP